MGCICSKATRANEHGQNNNKEKSRKESKKSAAKKRQEIINENKSEDDNNNNSKEDEKKKSNINLSRLLSLGGGERGAQVVAGWPSWLTAVAGEAINGWAPRRAESFEKLVKVGQGTYSNVYKARDLETNKIVALKKVRFATMDPESVRFMAREIIILRKLDHPNVMKLEGIITSNMSGSLYLIFEYMEHDLAGLLATPGVSFTEPQIKCYMKQLFHGLQHCHSRGVLHRDIKGSNLLLDQNGNLKIADFGLATFFSPPPNQPLTSRVVTLWYRPPELLLGATTYGVSVDLWSSGCILAELFVGKPIMPGRTEVEQLHKIFKLCGSPSQDYWKKSKLPNATVFKPQQPYKRRVAETFTHFPSSALALLDVLLAVEPDARKSVDFALSTQFFINDPLPCDPSSLPKYPPTKEFDVKFRDDGRRKGFGGKGNRKTSKESKAMARTNSEMIQQKAHKQSNPKVSSNPAEEEGQSRNVFANLGQSMHMSHANKNSSFRVNGLSSTSPKPQILTNQRSFSQALVGRGNSHLDSSSSTLNPRYNNLEVSSHHIFNRQKLSNMEDLSMNFKSSKDPFYNKGRIHCSGPLTSGAGGNIDEMLKLHEKHIKEVVRKTKANKTVNANEKNDSQLYIGERGR
ncbi:probable serine/threonine-protein kinase At1g09600 [Euphorbia lathyris]|uniref:probable serine/threonine-protein kinase At1g09600 n=1 Tax=Euphorbia lathyris TaxID=212925 RepID=UPI003313471C